MWQTSYGDRTLEGAEAILVRRLVGYLSDQIEIAIDIEFPYVSGVEIFDELQPNQQLAILHEVARALLVESVPAPKLTAIREATVYVLFKELHGLIDLEIGLSRMGKFDDYMRSVVVDAIQQKGPGPEDWTDPDEEAPSADGDDLELWVDVCEGLADRILWDRDFEMVASFADQAPEVAANLKVAMGIDHDYYSDIAPDSASEAFQKIRKELFELIGGKA